MKSNYILSRILLLNYLLVVLHIGISHCHFSELCQGEKTHQHKPVACEAIYQEHGIHGSFFHILEHLFEDVEHLDHQNHDHIVSNPGQILKLPKSDLKLFDFSTLHSSSGVLEPKRSYSISETNSILLPRDYAIFFQSRGPPTNS